MTIGELINKLYEIHPDYPVHLCYSDDGRNTLEVDVIKGFEGMSSDGTPVVGVLLMNKDKHQRGLADLDYTNIPHN
jgi:hypothetical protein